ncbi:hypothetical protein ACA910_020047 [Epithemia clementina (nom. ined.)]
MSSETKASYGAVPTSEERAAVGLDSDSAPIKKKSCNDFLFAILFLAHLGYVIYTWASYDPSGVVVVNGQEIDIADKFTDKGVASFVGIATATALVLSTMAIIIMTTFSDELIEIALAAPILGSLVVGGYGIYLWKDWMMITGGVAFLVFVVLACVVRRKVDFAAANLRVALTVIRTNFGLIIVAYILEVVAFAWSVLWFDATGAAMSETSYYIAFLYLLSFFWTHQVINNLQHVIVASVLGTWWYNPEDANWCWDDGLNQAICHSLTFSFGSICFGSLAASTIQALKWVHRMFASQTNRCGKCVTGLIDCILCFIQGLIEYFNKWAFVMVGIHGDSYIQGGREIIRLFKVRNWTGIVEDGLADLVMFFMKLAIALVTGLTGWWLVNRDDDIFAGVGIDPEDDDLIGFVAGVMIGYVVASIMMELVSSAVNAVIVCFAKSPAPFKRHYPALCNEMLTGWKKAYPIECEDEIAAITV